MRLDATEFAAALGLAANLASGYNEWAASGATEMFFHPGFAARNALLAASLLLLCPARHCASPALRRQ